MDIQPIRNDANHRRALRELSAFFDHEFGPGTPDDDRFEVLLTLVEAYEVPSEDARALLQPQARGQIWISLRWRRPSSRPRYGSPTTHNSSV